MDPHDRFFRRSLRDVLVSDGVLTSEQADELVESAYENDEQFGAVVVDAGYLTAWDLMQKVAATYQLPVIPLDGYEIDPELIGDDFPTPALYQYQMFPLGRFGKVWSWAIAAPPTRDCMDFLRKQCGPSHFFFVADMSILQRVIQDHVKVVDAESDSSWQNIFDSGDEAVKQEITGGAE